MRDVVTPSAIVEPTTRVHGSLAVPGDKSISHRYAMLAALAEGRSMITGFAPGDDCASTLRCLASLGVSITRSPAGADAAIAIEGMGLGGLGKPRDALDAANSGTTLRLLAGILAAHPFSVELTGDASLRRRPMRRIVEPLERMGARIDSSDGCPPLHVHGASLVGIEYTPPVASAQVKSAVLLAGLHASGRTWVHERVPTRDHTERALLAFGHETLRDGTSVGVEGGRPFRATTIAVPGDFSSAAFWLAAAAALPGSEIEIQGVGLNPTRTAFLDILRTAGADVEVSGGRLEDQEPCGTVRLRHHPLRPIEIPPDQVPGLIDELPALAALAVHANGLSVSGAGELRHKESDRIAVLASGLRAMGARIDEQPDGFMIHAGTTLTGGVVDARGDHRMAMAFAVAALAASGPTTIIGHEAVDVSYPSFFATLQSIRR